MAKVVAEEVMTEFNTRSDVGRVVVNPPTRMSPLELHDTLPMYLCCGRAFLSEESYVNHKAETIVHGKPIDLTNIRTAINSRSSIAFWRSRKINTAKMVEDEEEEEEEDESQEALNGCDQDDGDDLNEDLDYLSQQMIIQRKQPSYKVKGRVRCYKTCTLCKLHMPGTNIPRHMRTCHNPSNEFVCRYCSCRFVGAYGRLIHELKSHKKKGPTKPAVRIAKKLQPKKLPLKTSISVPRRSEKQVLNESIGYVKLSSTSYQCNVCKKIFQCAVNAKDHLNQHTGKRPYNCSHCGLTFTFKSSVSRHIKSCHVLGGEYPCPVNCGCIMGNKISLQMHATLCKKRKVEANLIKTVKVQEQQPIKKQAPKHQTSTLDSVKASQVGPNLYHCDICNKDITCSGNFRDHLNSHAGSRPHRCPMCSLTFTFRSNIQRHIKTSHVEDGAYVCPNNCGCTLATVVALKGHMFSCRKKMLLEGLLQKMDEPASGKISPKRSPSPPKISPMQSTSPSKMIPKRYLSSSKKILKRSRGRSKRTTVDKFECEVCKKVVISKRNLRNHMLIHLNLKPFKCEMCGHFFRATESLKKHQERSHAPTGTYMCPDCPCQFNREQGLMMHKNMYHTKKALKKIQGQKSLALPPMPKLKPMPPLQPKPNILSSLLDKKPSKLQLPPPPMKTETDSYECRVCGKILQSLNSLRNHGFIHSGEKPYECNICGHRFRLSSTLYDHKRSSHSGGTFMCKKCPCRFESEHGLYRHEGVFHGRVSLKYARRKASLIKNKALKLKATNYDKPAPQLSNSSNSSPRTSPIKNMRNRNSLIKSLPKLTAQPFRQVSFKMEVGDDDDSNGFQCGHCGVFLKTLQELSDHQRIHTQPEPEKPPKQCPVCSQKIFDSSHYRVHMKSNHSGGEYQCGDCPCDFDSQGSLTRHRSRYHPNFGHSTAMGGGRNDGMGPGRSNVMGAGRSNGMGPVVIEVESTDHEVGFEVYDDEIREVRPASIPQKVQGVPKPKPVQRVTKLNKKDIMKSCDVCGKMFTRLQSYKDHMSIHLNIRPYNCNICFQTFRLSSILSTHKRTSHGNGRFHCADCPTQFTTPKGLSVHRFVYHKGGRIETGETESTYEQEQPMEDDQGEDYFEDQDIEYGMYSDPVQAPIMQAKASPKDRPMKCKDCGEICLGPNRLQEHMELHQEAEMPTECSGCGRFFGTMAEFEHHIQVNAGDPFRCAYCCATMTTEEALQEHFDSFHSQEEEEAEVSEYMESQMDLDFVS